MNLVEMEKKQKESADGEVDGMHLEHEKVWECFVRPGRKNVEVPDGVDRVIIHESADIIEMKLPTSVREVILRDKVYIAKVLCSAFTKSITFKVEQIQAKFFAPVINYIEHWGATSDNKGDFYELTLLGEMEVNNIHIMGNTSLCIEDLVKVGEIKQTGSKESRLDICLRRQNRDKYGKINTITACHGGRVEIGGYLDVPADFDSYYCITEIDGFDKAEIHYCSTVCIKTVAVGKFVLSKCNKFDIDKVQGSKVTVKNCKQVCLSVN